VNPSISLVVTPALGFLLLRLILVAGITTLVYARDVEDMLAYALFLEGRKKYVRSELLKVISLIFMVMDVCLGSLKSDIGTLNRSQAIGNIGKVPDQCVSRTLSVVD